MTKVPRLPNLDKMVLAVRVPYDPKVHQDIERELEEQEYTKWVDYRTTPEGGLPEKVIGSWKLDDITVYVEHREEELLVYFDNPKLDECDMDYEGLDLVSRMLDGRSFV